MNRLKLILLAALQLRSGSASPRNNAIVRRDALNWNNDEGLLNFDNNNICGIWKTEGSILKGEEHDYFGSAVSTSADGKTVAISSDRYVKVFSYDDSTKRYKIIGDEIIPLNDRGERVLNLRAISLSRNGRTIAIANVENNNPDERDLLMSGGVSVYRLNRRLNSWHQIGKRIVMYGGFIQTTASISLSDDGLTLAFASSGSGVDVHGKTKVYKYNVSEKDWILKGRPIAEKTMNVFLSDEVDVSLSADGNTIAVGSSRNSVNGIQTGRARVLIYKNDNWELLASFHGFEEYGYFGKSVSLSSDGRTLAVGSDGYNSNSGKVQVFTFDSEKWVQVGADIVGKEMNYYLGTSVAISSNANDLILAVGAIGAQNFVGSAMIYQYKKISGKWRMVGQSIDGFNNSNLFGASVALSSDGKTAVVGSPFSSYRNIGREAGSAYILELAETTCSPTSSPSEYPTTFPTIFPSDVPTYIPTFEPTALPSNHPSNFPSKSMSPTDSASPTESISPSLLPSRGPSGAPSSSPSARPTRSLRPTSSPTMTYSSTYLPTLSPTNEPTARSSLSPTASPTNDPTVILHPLPSSIPSSNQQPSTVPSHSPTKSSAGSPPPSRPSIESEAARMMISPDLITVRSISGSERMNSSPSKLYFGITAMVTLFIMFL